MDHLSRSFYNKDPLQVCRSLLGNVLVRSIGRRKIIGRIVEVEAYVGPEDKASHAYRNRKSSRTYIQYGERGYSYIFRIYGIYCCLCIVVGPGHIPAVCLIRAVEPLLGLDSMMHNRNSTNSLNLTNGPGKLCQAFGVDERHNGLDLCNSRSLFVARGDAIDRSRIRASQRIGIDYSGSWKNLPWRFYIADNPFVSRA